MAMGRRNEARRRAARAAGGDFRASPQAVCLSAALLAVLAPPASAQYLPTGPGTLGSGSLPGTAGSLPGTFGGGSPYGLAPEAFGTLGEGQRKWEIIPRLGVQETYTDNVRLQPPGSERSDWVTEVRPGVSINGRGARLRFNFDYSPDLVYRKEEGSHDVFHNLNAFGNAELVRQLLFVDTRANVFQSNVALFGPQAVSNANSTDNRTTVRTFFLSPYLRHDFGSEAQGEARYSFSTLNSGSTGGASTSNSDANRIDARLSSGPAYKLQTWNLTYSKEHIDYTETHQSIDTEMISAYGRRLITPTLGLQATVGYENNDYGVAANSPKGKFWSIGPDWAPTDRTRLSATMGRRYYGPNQALDFTHRTRLTTWGLSYHEDVTTTRGQFFVPTIFDSASYLNTLFLASIPDPAARQTAVQNFISQAGIPSTLTVPLNYFTTVPYLQKTANASFGILGVRNTVLFNVFSQKREAISANQPLGGVLGQATSSTQNGTSLLWTSRLTQLTTSNATIGYSRTEAENIGTANTGASAQYNLTYIRLGLTTQFQPKITGTLSYRRLRNDSNQAGGDYNENAVSALLNMRF